MYPRRSIVAAMLAVSAMGGVHAQTVSAGGYSLTVIGDLGGPRDSRYNGSAGSPAPCVIYRTQRQTL
ncbi:hypothetical protein [Burkholderia contaminans]|jgi:hypothetical protein|uniref:Calcium-binding protein n=2 Tax=Burkholderia contaminans TaxID=488447 RepID=A0ABS3PC35_9BURK|nr:hypothetical protein [Burkholderia contaminans]KKL40607.1 hypothetical protein WR31_22760 [Burkholderia contaminans LMG 23361]MBK1908403.1 hypothetical protein [Burkholderia contaminans]MBO1829822.1 hypothetical protein [Burkholderia contaminans]ODN22580.1 hypothetical protein BGI28_30475 [Burkholderia contaminans]QFR10983.1 hypothetical protein SK875_A02809 [Burkholderia contaminans]